MRAHRFVSPLLALLLTGACAMTRPQPSRAEFQDIPVPEGLTYQPDRSASIESPSVKAARLVYRGRFEPESLGTLMRSTLEASGWRHLSSTFTPGRGATQIYQKGGSSLQVQIWESGLFNWFTYVELTTSQATPGSASLQ